MSLNISSMILTNATFQPKDNIVSVDIETECNIASCDKKGKCDHALNPHTARISCIGLYCEVVGGTEFKRVFRSIQSFNGFVNEHPTLRYIGHNFKFDFKHLTYHGVNLGINQYYGDTQNMASVCTSKVLPDYLAWYEGKRKQENEKLAHGFSHRNGGALSLKTLAPFFLKVKPFWETPENHDNDEYVLKDAQYTYQLYWFFKAELEKANLMDFYQTKLMNWSRMIVEAEQKGITLDLLLMEQRNLAATVRSYELKKKLDELWKDAYQIYYDMQLDDLNDEYKTKMDETWNKKKEHLKTPDRHVKHIQKYSAMFDKAAKKIPLTINLDSPVQLKWLLKDHFGLDIENFKDEESTGKEVLQKLIREGREDIATFLEYRKYKKLTTSFYPSYREMQVDGKIHCNFNTTGTRTGRLSSSSPNLQQVPTDLHSLFIARPGYKLVTRDLSAIEPCLAGFYTEDHELCDLLIRGGDFHSRNAIIMFGLECDEKDVKDRYPVERKIAKTCGLALLYGAGPFRIQQTAMQNGLDWNIGYCKQLFDNFKNTYETAFEFKKMVDREALNGPIETMFGRKHYYPDPTEIYMKAFNTLIQSSASDLLLQGAYQAWTRLKELDIDGYPLLFVHDEVVFEVKEGDAEYANKIIDEELTSFILSTPYGNIPLKTEGKVSDKWEK